MSKTEYKKVSLMTLAGITAAEKMHVSEKWTVVYSTYSCIMFERKI